jgi:hypothetical protein
VLVATLELVETVEVGMIIGVGVITEEEAELVETPWKFIFAAA